MILIFHSITFTDVLQLVKSQVRPSFRPTVPTGTGAPTDFISLMEKCWDDSQMERPTSKDVMRAIYQMNKKNHL